MKDFRAVFIFIVVAFIIPPIVSASGGILAQILCLATIGIVLFYVHALDAQARLLRS